jgi:hypothetical protein
VTLCLAAHTATFAALARYSAGCGVEAPAQMPGHLVPGSAAEARHQSSVEGVVLALTRERVGTSALIQCAGI